MDWASYVPNPSSVYIVAVTTENELVADRMPSGEVARHAIVSGNYDRDAGYKAASILVAGSRDDARRQARGLGRTWKNAR